MPYPIRKALFALCVGAASLPANVRGNFDAPPPPEGVTATSRDGVPEAPPAADSASHDAPPPAPAGPPETAPAPADDRLTLQNCLPPALAESVDLTAWGWFSYLHTSGDGHDTYSDVDLALGVTRRFGDRVAGTVDVHFLDADDHPRGFLEQAFVTAELSERNGTLLTAGKFNAGFGVEPRNAWDRLTGTTSLLFGAEPQDLIGLVLTQPLGQTGVTLRPFVANGFAGRFDFDQPPSAGLTVEYRPSRELDFAVTQWVGPGFARESAEEYGGTAVASAARIEADEYSSGAGGAPAGEYATGHRYASGYGYAFGNWRGPDPAAGRGGTVYLLDARVTWTPRADLTLAAEGLLATTGPSAGRFGWGGVLVLANYDLTDRWRVFARWSFLDDAQGFVTGLAQRRHELSGGVGFQVVRGVELRGEYRHDFSDRADDLDSVSVHLTFTF